VGAGLLLGAGTYWLIDFAQSSLAGEDAGRRDAVADRATGRPDSLHASPPKTATDPRAPATESPSAMQWASLPQDVSQVDRQQLREAIDQAAQYLIRVCDEEGRFAYRINLNPEVTPKPAYNMLRHGGTIYALGMYDRWRPSQPARDAMARAAEYLKRTSLQPVAEGDDLLAIWTFPEMTGEKPPVAAKLGGAGLGLVALMSVERVKPGSTSLDDLRRLGRFIVFMQKEDGSFYSKYIPSEGGRYAKWVSLYYPGEAALGLLMLFEKDPSPVWFESASRAIHYLARLRADKRKVEADHWALLATAKLLSLAEQQRLPVPREDVLQHAIDVAESMLGAIPRYHANPAAIGCMTRDGRTCPTATRLEGLLAALGYLPEEEWLLRQRITASVQQGTAFLLRCRIQGGDHAGAIPHAVLPRTGSGAVSFDSASTRASEVRIDYVQHALSAMIQYDGTFHRPGQTTARRQGQQ
jgi:hypothetical protein